MGIRQIALRLSLSRNTVRAILKAGGAVNLAPRKNEILVDVATLTTLYTKCSGWKERMWEKLTDEHGVEIGYSTLTRKVRELGLGAKPRAAKVPDEPGGEMQHDTSPYRLPIGGRHMGVIASLLYYRYSKQYYLHFYRSFNRFRMKCFFHEALTFYGYAAPDCIIDNTHLAVLSGTGKNAVMAPEMAGFGRRYGFRFIAHEIKHSNRKAGDERGFWTVETNFFPGREFSSMEDLNAQAKAWATETMAKRPRGKARLIPLLAFEEEKTHLLPISVALPPPYTSHTRAVDQYGFVAFNANYYWLPGGVAGEVKVLEYSTEIKVFAGRREVARYPLPPDGVKNKIFPEDRPHVPYQPRHRENPTGAEEAAMRATAPEVGAYLDFALKGHGLSRHRQIRSLYGLFRRLSRPLFCKVTQRAHHFRVTDIETLGEIARQLLRDMGETMPDVVVDESYETRESFQEGRLTEPADLQQYDRQFLEDGDDD